MPHIVRLDGAVDAGHLGKTFKKLVRRHESFRTSFAIINDKPVQYIHPDVPFKMEPIAPGLYDDVVNRFIRPFDMRQAPLLRVGLMEIKKDSHLLMVDMHHIISDGTSVGHTVRRVYETL